MHSKIAKYKLPVKCQYSVSISNAKGIKGSHTHGRKAKTVCVKICPAQIVFQIQITVKNVIEIQNTKYISKATKYEIQITYNMFQIHILITCISNTSQPRSLIRLVEALSLSHWFS